MRTTTIEVREFKHNLSQAQTQKVKRVANVLRDAGMDVEIIWHEAVLKPGKESK